MLEIPRYELERIEETNRRLTKGQSSLLSPSLTRDLMQDRDARRADLRKFLDGLTEGQLDDIAGKIGRPINSEFTYEKLRDHLFFDQISPEPERKYDAMIQQAKEQSGTLTTTAATAAQAQTENPNSPNSLAFYSRISNPMDAAEQMGMWLFKSAMLGVGTKDAGITVALTCLTEKISPMEFTRRYHIIEGRPSMRADYMLARFEELGGKKRIINRNPACAEIELEWNGEKTKFSFTWEDAQQEPFVKDKKGNIKTNYATPRARMQMLWARCVSDAIRTVCPQVNCGTYSPEEVVDMIGGDSTIIDAEYQVKTDTGAEATEVVEAVEAVEAVEVQAVPAESKTKPQHQPQLEQSSGGVARDQLSEAAKMKDLLRWDSTKWKSLISNPKLGGVQSMKEMSFETAERLLVYLRKEVAKLPKAMTETEETLRDELSEWAEGALVSGKK